MTEQTVKYLKARLEKLTAAERIGSFLMGEVYVAKRCKYSRANGRIYGMDQNTPTKTLLTTMFKSIASKYEDVIAMIPLTKIDSAKINNLFMKCLETNTPLGSLVDGHSSNVKFHKNELCDGEIKPYIENPLDNTKKIFLSFDSTCIFKCIYNNFEAKKSFECTPFDGSEPFTASFEHIKELYNLEFSKPVKMAFELNHETLNPQPIEKTKVSLASRIFSESTRNAVKFYTENGYPHWEGTLKFLQIIAKWWNILNVKTAFKGIHI